MKKIILIFLMMSILVYGDINSEFVKAFESGNVSLVKSLLNKGADINTENNYGGSALTVSLRNNRKTLAKFLIEKGIDIHKIERIPGEEDEPYYKSAFIIATEQNDTEMMRLLLKKGAKISYQPGCDGSPMLTASKNNNVEAIKLLIEMGADVNEKVRGGDTPLLNAVCYNSLEVAKILIEEGADVNEKVHGRTLLLWALRAGSERTALLLIEKGADIFAKSEHTEYSFLNHEDGNSALHFASAQNLKNVVVLLVERGLDVNYKNSNGSTPLHVANSELVSLLVENGSNVNEKNNQGVTRLHRDAWDGKWDVVNYLLNNKASIDAISNEGETPLMYAIEEGEFKTVKLLLNKGANCNLKNIKGLSPLMIMVESYNVNSENSEDFLLEYFEENQTDFYQDLDEVVSILVHNTKEENAVFIENESEYEYPLYVPVLVEAIFNEHEVLANLLIKNGINTSLTMPYNTTTLMIATESDLENTVQLLLEIGAPVNEVITGGEYKGETALSLAVRNNNKNIVKNLVAYGAKNIKGGKSLLSLAEDSEMKQLLIKLELK